ncbi:alanine racemase [Sphingomonas oligophenolica]|uniref:alanine racemase n=1 Tax=Sphingomonas oligophenolica TaxID=301154 RepID=A0ABU9Y1C7_9SPHN
MNAAASLSNKIGVVEDCPVIGDGRGNRLTLDVAAFRSNVLETRRLVGSPVRLLQVIKGDGYGLGLERAVALGISAGVDGFCVGTPDEALRATAMQPLVPILLFTACPPGLLPDLASQGIIISVNSVEAMEALIESGLSAQIYVELDCGFGRFGLDAVALDSVLDLYCTQDKIALAGVYTHFGQGDDLMLDSGLAAFDRAIERLRQRVPPGFDTMVASTHTLLRRPHLPYNAVDPGRLLYGIVDSPVDQARFRPVIAAISSQIIQINRVANARSVTIGYGNQVRLPAGGATGVFPLGWHDGLSVRGGLGEVIIHGRRAPVIARTLLHSIVDLSSVPEATIGDEVFLIGKQGESCLTLGEAAQAQGVSATELHFRLAGAIAAKSVRCAPT